MTRATVHHAALDGLRFFAFMAVFVHHALHIPLLWMGVDLFFVLSGYLITGILIRTRASAGYFRLFYVRRALRIFPPYYAVLAIVFLVLYPGYLPALPWFAAYVSNINSAWTLTPAPDPVTAMWSLAIEEQFYLLWPLVLALVPLRRIPTLCGVLFVVANLTRAACAVFAQEHWPAYYLLPSRMDLLAIGASIAAWEHLRPGSLRRFAVPAGLLSFASIAAVVAIGLAVPTFRTGANSLSFNTLGYSLIGLAGGGCVLYVLHGPAGLVQRVLSWAPLRYLGTISYACYLVHSIVLDQVERTLEGRASIALCAWVITVGIASLSWFALERPVQRLKERRFRYARVGV